MTDKDIRSLRREAEHSGDLRLAMICVLAVGGVEALEDSEPEPGTEASILLTEGRTQEWARQECERVIADAAAQI